MPIIVYLDQNIVSNLVKHRQGHIEDSSSSKIYNQLNKAIQQCARKGCHIFPTSSVHTYEAQFDSNIDDAEWRYLKDISHGLAFLDSSQIIDTQIRSALYRWLKEPSRRCYWEGVFTRDPNEPYVPSRYEVYVRFPYSSDYTERQRSVRNEIPTLLESMIPITSKRTAAEQTELELKYTIVRLFFPWGIDWSACVSLDEKIGQELFYADAISRLEYLSTRGLSAKDIGSFLQSQELAQVPIINIRAALFAHLMVNSARRTPIRSDPDDIDIMAMTLPYCDIVTTDKYMKKIVVEDLKLSNRYRTTVLSAKLEDVEKLALMLG